MFPITAGLGALSLLNSLLQSTTASGSSTQTGTSQTLGQALGDGDGDQSQNSQTPVGSGGTTPPFNPRMLAALFSLQGQQSNGTNGTNGSGGLFAKLDSDGDGKISQREFESALGANGVDSQSADALFGKLDANGDGSVSQNEFTGAWRHRFHPHRDPVIDAGPGGILSRLNGTDASGVKTQTATNADGSTTTTITYSDGSTVSMTTPAAATSTSGDGSGSGSTTSTSQSNLLEQLIKLQSQFVARSGAGLSTLA